MLPYDTPSATVGVMDAIAVSSLAVLGNTQDGRQAKTSATGRVSPGNAPNVRPQSASS